MRTQALGNRTRHSGLLARRDVLRAGGLGLFGLSTARLEAAREFQSQPAPTARAVIFLYQFGGPSHGDTLDMKPLAPDGVRSHFPAIATSCPDIRACDQLPELAKVMNKVTLVRTVHHHMKNHNSASYFALTGVAPTIDDIRLKDTDELHPAYGSIVQKLVPAGTGMPGFVALPHVIRDGSITPGQRATFLGKAQDPLLITQDPASPEFHLPELTLPDHLTADRMQSRRSMQELLNRQSSLMDDSAAVLGFDAQYQRAMAMLNTPHVRNAFDLSQEPESLRRKYGMTTYGQSCLLARRLVEGGVKFINVYFSDTIGGRYAGKGGWDTHGFDNTRMYPVLKNWQLPLTDQTLPTLLTDLDERGLLDETLVVWMGEFGRTPRINANVSRDHWPHCFTALLAGGGTKRGFVYGESDRSGAYPARDPVHIGDLAATIYRAVGIDAATEIHDATGRPFRVATGNPVLDVFA